MPNPKPLNDVARHIELLNVYHLDLWSEIESQLRVLRDVQVQIGALRESRNPGDAPEATRSAAEVLRRHVQTLKGRCHTLSATIEELETTVGELTTLLAR